MNPPRLKLQKQHKRPTTILPTNYLTETLDEENSVVISEETSGGDSLKTQAQLLSNSPKVNILSSDLILRKWLCCIFILGSSPLIFILCVLSHSSNTYHYKAALLLDFIALSSILVHIFVGSLLCFSLIPLCICLGLRTIKNPYYLSLSSGLFQNILLLFHLLFFLQIAMISLKLDFSLNISWQFTLFPSFPVLAILLLSPLVTLLYIPPNTVSIIGCISMTGILAQAALSLIFTFIRVYDYLERFQHIQSSNQLGEYENQQSIHQPENSKSFWYCATSTPLVVILGILCRNQIKDHFNALVRSSMQQYDDPTDLENAYLIKTSLKSYSPQILLKNPIQPSQFYTYTLPTNMSVATTTTSATCKSRFVLNRSLSSNTLSLDPSKNQVPFLGAKQSHRSINLQKSQIPEIFIGFKDQEVIVFETPRLGISLTNRTCKIRKTKSLDFKIQADFNKMNGEDEKQDITISNHNQTAQISTNQGKSRIEEEKESTFCTVCFDNQPNSVIMSCGHGGICYECATKMWNQTSSCYICKQVISQIFEIESASVNNQNSCSNNNPQIFQVISKTIKFSKKI